MIEGGRILMVRSSTIRLCGDALEITNPQNIQPVSADFFTECREYNGIVRLSFA